MMVYETNIGVFAMKQLVLVGCCPYFVFAKQWGTGGTIVLDGGMWYFVLKNRAVFWGKARVYIYRAFWSCQLRSSNPIWQGFVSFGFVSRQ